MATYTRSEIAPGVHFVQGPESNWVLLVEDGQATLVDSGYPADAPSVSAGLEELGLRLQDVVAVLLTHAHIDHVGGAMRLRQQWSELRVLAAPAEVPNARGEVHESATTGDILPRAWRPRTAAWAARIIRRGALTTVGVADCEPFDPSGALDVPGRPVPVPTPGHTSGHCSFALPQVGVVVTGDALVTAHPTVPRGVRPQQLPGFFSTDPSEAAESLGALAALDAEVLLPGHGPAHHGSAGRAVERALVG